MRNWVDLHFAREKQKTNLIDANQTIKFTSYLFFAIRSVTVMKPVVNCTQTKKKYVRFDICERKKTNQISDFLNGFDKWLSIEQIKWKYFPILIYHFIFSMVTRSPHPNEPRIQLLLINSSNAMSAALRSKNQSNNDQWFLVLFSFAFKLQRKIWFHFNLPNQICLYKLLPIQCNFVFSNLLYCSWNRNDLQFTFKIFFIKIFFVKITRHNKFGRRSPPGPRSPMACNENFPVVENFLKNNKISLHHFALFYEYRSLLFEARHIDMQCHSIDSECNKDSMGWKLRRLIEKWKTKGEHKKKLLLNNLTDK